MATADELAAALFDLDSKLQQNPNSPDAATWKASYDNFSHALSALALEQYDRAADEVTKAAQALLAAQTAPAAVAHANTALQSLGKPPVSQPQAQPQAPAPAQPQGQAGAPPQPAQPAPPAAPAGGQQGRMNAGGYALLRQWEGCILYAYDDYDDHRVQPGEHVHGTLTIGYGHTGPDVFAGQVWTQAQANAMLTSEANTVAANISPLIKRTLSDNQFSAFVCFAFNIGIAGFGASSALKLANAGDFAGVPARIAVWNKTTIDGVLTISPGLTNRRAAEIALWNTP